MKRCKMMFKLLFMVVSVLVLIFSFTNAAKEETQPKSIQALPNAITNPNPNWDLKAQNEGVIEHDQPEAKVEDVPNPNPVFIAEEPEGGLAIGDDCTNPIVITLPADMPYSDLNQTTVGRVNNYSATCLGNYDGGEDIVYKITVTSAINVLVTLNPKGTTYGGFAIDENCPLDASGCVLVVSSSSGAAKSGIAALAVGTYYLIVDTWPAPTNIPNFDLTITAAPAPPANDNCASAIPIGDVSLLAFDCSYATMDGPGGFVNNRNIWYCYTATCNGTATASLCNSTYDTRVRIWDMCTCPPTVALATDDDACAGPGSGLASIVSWDVVMGNQYLIEIGPYSSTTTVGSGFLTTTCAAPVPGDGCGLPIDITLNPSVIPLTLTSQYNCGRINNYSATCLGSYDGGEDIIYRLDVTQPTYVDVTVNPKGTTYAGFLIDDACPPDPTTCLYIKTNGSSGAAFTINGANLAVGTYWLMVDTYPSPNCIPDFDLSFTVPVGPPPNDDCATATAIGNVTDLAFTTNTASFDGPGGYIAGANIWYCYTSACDGMATVSLCNSGYDTKVRVWDGCTCPPTLMLVQDDDACSTPNGLASLASWPVVNGGQYLIEVGGYTTATGNGFITTSCCAFPPNDNCASVTPVTLTSGVPVTFTGNNSCATNDCASFPGGNVWEAFTITACADVTLDYCGTSPAFGNAWLNLANGCPCASFTAAGTFNTTSCGDGNVSITWSGLGAGTYYYPVLNDPANAAVGPYTINVVAITTTSYCAPSGFCDEYISRVQVGTIDNSSSCAGTYDDYTDMTIVMIQGECYPIIVTNGLPYSGDQCGIWADWDHDFCFSASERILPVSGSPGGGPYTAVIQPPAHASGMTRLRVRIVYTGVLPPCGATAYGETEDYSIDVQPFTPNAISISPDPMYVYYQFAIPPKTDTIYFGNLVGHTAGDVVLSTVKVNGTPVSATLAPAVCGFAGSAVCIVQPISSFMPFYGLLFGTNVVNYTVTGDFTDASSFAQVGSVTLIGKNPLAPTQYLVPNNEVVVGGDFDLSGLTDISDAVAMIEYIFGGGFAPSYLMIGDTNCSGDVDVSDAVLLIQYIFSGGAAPCRYGSGS